MVDVTVTWIDGLKEDYDNIDFVTVDDGILRLIRYFNHDSANSVDLEYSIPVEHVRIWKEE